MNISSMKTTLGWREWVELPQLGLPPIKAKVDTGARTSCLHAFELQEFTAEQGGEWVRFKVHPHQHDDQVAVCEAPVFDRREVTDSGGHREQRIVISSRIVIGSWQEEIELTLTARDTMKFRMLLGRTAMTKGQFLVDPSLSYQTGTPARNPSP